MLTAWRRLFMLGAALVAALTAFSQFHLHTTTIDSDSIWNEKTLGLQNSFKNRTACTEYIYQIPALLQGKGFAGAAIDSIRFDSANAYIRLFVGDNYKWDHLITKRSDLPILTAVGWNDKYYSGKPFNYQKLETLQQQTLNYLENNGYPFARISLDSILLDSSGMSANFKIDRGPFYKIDSIRVYGSAKISNSFLQHYLNIEDGSTYKKEKLLAISRKIRELPFLEEEKPSTVTLLGTGSVLNLYLRPKKSSQVNVLIGLLPSSDALTSNKLLVTGEATVNLKNSLGNGETIGLNWQQVQVKSPRLNLVFQEPFIFNSAFGMNAAFDLFKKDSSYININMVLGAQYTASTNKTGSVFIQNLITNLLTVDSQQVIATHQLPTEADIHSVSLGVNYEFNNTNYRFNPVSGNEFRITGTVGTKTIKKNAVIERLIDPADSSFNFSSLYDTLKLNSYEFRVRVQAAHYFRFSRATTLKLGFDGGVFQSPSTFRNEVFQIGGYKLLRGFDEESILASQYVVGTLEYRYLIGQNSFLFGFTDLGWAKNNIPGYALNSSYLGFGAGLAFETKAGIFNISYAIGKTGDNPVSFRQAKIHLGYVNIF